MSATVGPGIFVARPPPNHFLPRTTDVRTTLTELRRCGNVMQDQRNKVAKGLGWRFKTRTLAVNAHPNKPRRQRQPVFQNTILRRKAAVDYCTPDLDDNDPQRLGSAALVLRRKQRPRTIALHTHPVHTVNARQASNRKHSGHSTSPLAKLLPVLESALKDNPRRYKIRALRRTCGYRP